MLRFASSAKKSSSMNRLLCSCSWFSFSSTPLTRLSQEAQRALWATCFIRKLTSMPKLETVAQKSLKEELLELQLANSLESWPDSVDKAALDPGVEQ